MRLTPNRRLAVYVSKDRKPVLPFNEWLKSLWDQVQNNHPGRYPKLLTLAEQEILWEKIICATQADIPLLRITSTATVVREAWELCHQWCVSWGWGESTEDSRAYERWANTYRSLCETNHWIDTAVLLDFIIDLVDTGIVELPSVLNCIGFLEWTPQQNRFLEHCRKRGIRIEFHSLTSQIAKLQRLGVCSEGHELTTAVQGIQQWLIKDPSARIAVIIPNLEQCRFEVERVFKDHLAETSFNISAPLPLFEYPLFQSILLGLKMVGPNISFETFSQYCRSSFFGQAITEASERATLEVLLRNNRKDTYTLISLIEAIEICLKKMPEGSCEHLLSSLQKILVLNEHFNVKQTARIWKERFTEALIILEWPGERALNEEERQLQEQWELLLDEYVRMEDILDVHNYTEAIDHIQRLFRGKQFLPNTQLNTASVQGLGLLEALGIPFDYMWVMGLHRHRWPADPTPNPYIPLAIQRSLGLPKSSAARELQIARDITEQLCVAAKEIIFSYPDIIEDQMTSISPLLAHIPESREYWSVPSVFRTDKDSRFIQNVFQSDYVAPLRVAVSSQSALTSSNEMQSLEKKLAEVGGSSETQVPILGGTRVLKLQALCPFRAFAEIRLKAVPSPASSTSLGLMASERGDIVHQCLFYFWQGLSDQNALKALSESECSHRIESIVDRVFRKWQLKYPEVLTDQYRKLEQKRTVLFVQRFIQLERARPFFEVVGVEVVQAIVLGGIQLKFKIDRIDRLENGEELFIDYKTGKVHIAEWFGVRPLDPQLPLYCIARKPTPSGAAFAVIRPDIVEFQGLSTSGKHLPGVEPLSKVERYGAAATWQEQISVWQQDMERLAQEFRMGKAEVDPVQGQKTCRTCHLKSLCRIEMASS